ncbi:hypothetical protein [Paenibacillus sp. NPDC058071]|uniref:hypothetical protein n=1 Tax=Paenibacillus sp. NPDC058071 TaxID=3346326 RepID=UPI0036D8242E
MSAKERIESALAAIARLTGESGIAWVVGGSAGLMLRELPLSSDPGDLDIYVDESQMEPFCRLLMQYATDEPHVSETSMYRSVLCHLRMEGIEVEIVGGFVVNAIESRYEIEVQDALVPLSDASVWLAPGGVTLVPLAHELLFNVLRGRADRCRLIAGAVAADLGRHGKALGVLESRNTLSDEVRAETARWIAECGSGALT